MLPHAADQANRPSSPNDPVSTRDGILLESRQPGTCASEIRSPLPHRNTPRGDTAGHRGHPRPRPLLRPRPERPPLLQATCGRRGWATRLSILTPERQQRRSTAKLTRHAETATDSTRRDRAEVLPEDMPGTVMIGPEAWRTPRGARHPRWRVASPPPAPPSPRRCLPSPPSRRWLAAPGLARPSAGAASTAASASARHAAAAAPVRAAAAACVGPQFRHLQEQKARTGEARSHSHGREPPGCRPRGSLCQPGIYGWRPRKACGVALATGGMRAAQRSDGIHHRHAGRATCRSCWPAPILTCAFTGVDRRLVAAEVRHLPGSPLGPERAVARGGRRREPRQRGLPFTIAILAALFVSWLVVAGRAALRVSIGAMTKARQSANASAATGNSDAVSAQEAFMSTCDGYADPTARQSRERDPNYLSGPSFLSADARGPGTAIT
jgi:hypothetical protein